MPNKKIETSFEDMKNAFEKLNKQKEQTTDLPIDVLLDADFTMVGNALLRPVLEVLPFETLAGKCLKQEMPIGKEYEKHNKKSVEIKYWAYNYPDVIATDGVPNNFPDVKLKDVLPRDEGYFARLQDRLRQNVEYQVDKEFIDFVTSFAGEPKRFSSFNKEFVEFAKQYSKIIIHRQHVVSIVKDEILNEISPVCSRELIMNGWIGALNEGKTHIITSCGKNTFEILEPNRILLIGKAGEETAGYMKPLTMEPLDKPKIIALKTDYDSGTSVGWEGKDRTEFFVDPKYIACCTIEP